jgi:hypothetical protein
LTHTRSPLASERYSIASGYPGNPNLIAFPAVVGMNKFKLAHY